MDTPSAHPDMSPGRILIVDDEVNIRQALVFALEMAGYQVEAAASGQEALAKLGGAPFDLMVLDLSMPGMDGVEVMRHVRDMGLDVLIVVLTGQATLESAIAAVKSGATDYLLKPVSVHELKAVVASALAGRAEQKRQRRVMSLIEDIVDVVGHPKGPEGGVPPVTEKNADGGRFLQTGELTLDRRRRLVTIGGPSRRSVELTEGEAGLLACLMQRAGETLSYQRLAYDVWGYQLSDQDAASMIRSTVYRLRQKIESDPNHPQLIRTVRGGGYYLHSGDS